MRLNECEELAFSPSAENTVKGRLWKRKRRVENELLEHPPFPSLPPVQKIFLQEQTEITEGWNNSIYHTSFTNTGYAPSGLGVMGDSFPRALP
jgi:hypothetical protein